MADMQSDPKSAYLVRHGIMSLLSDAEVAKVSTAETEVCLSYGDEFIDLEHLELGVRNARGETGPMGRLLTKKSVREETWTKIVAQLATMPMAPIHL
ncbi:MAG: hypothetical protein ABI461_03245 [Polyangiaceae bacterium]